MSKLFNIIKTGNITLKDAQARLRRVDTINCGGCGVAALALLKVIKREHPEDDVQIFFLYPTYEEYLYKSNMAELANQHPRLDAPSHIVIKYNGEFMDSMGVYDLHEPF